VPSPEAPRQILDALRDLPQSERIAVLEQLAFGQLASDPAGRKRPPSEPRTPGAAELASRRS
jgi:hypothetical protein